MKSVFNGEFRTATNAPYRGNGLSSVRSNVKANVFEGFEVISGRGRCIMPKDQDENEIITVSYSNTLPGTLYQFIIR